MSMELAAALTTQREHEFVIGFATERVWANLYAMRIGRHGLADETLLRSHKIDRLATTKVLSGKAALRFAFELIGRLVVKT
jgi:hypothetical protein